MMGLLPVSGRSVSVVLPALQVGLVAELELLLEEVNRILDPARTGDQPLLGDVEILYVEETWPPVR